MTSLPVLDTNLLIRLSHGDAAARRALERIRDEALVVPAQAAMEYLVGVDDPEGELEALHEAFEVHHTSDGLLLAAARLRSQARVRALQPRWGDIQIAAAAVLEGTFVVTTNKRHFTQLGVEAWHYLLEPSPPGSGPKGPGHARREGSGGHRGGVGAERCSR